MAEKIIIPVQEFLKTYGFIVPDWFVYVLLVILLAAITYGLKAVQKAGLNYFYYLKRSRDLHPFYTNKNVVDARRYFVPTKIQNKAPSNNDELIASRGIDITNDAIHWFIEEAFNENLGNRFYLILSDSGMGKTTFLINLYLKYTARILRKYDMKLYPIGNSRTFDEIKRMVENGTDKKTILLLDAFDEDNQALENWKSRFDEIINATHSFRGVVITSRTQFFPSEDDEPIITSIRHNGVEGGFHKVNKFYVTPFSENDINVFLSKKFKWFNLRKRGLKEKAQEIVNRCPNLMVRPMLLAYIDDLLDSNLKHDHTFQIYDALINRWIAREADRVEESKRERFRENLFKFSNVTAREIFMQWIGLKRNGLYLENNDISRISQMYEIKLTELEMKGKSLLNRNNIGQYKFAHKSILEYLLAYLCVTDEQFGKEFDSTGFDQAEKFVVELSKVQVVLRFLRDNNIMQSTKLFEYKVAGTETVIKRYMKTITLDDTQFERFLNKLDDAVFIKGINEINIEDIAILKDSNKYKIENLKKLYTLKRITIYKHILTHSAGRLIDLNSVLPNCYIPGYKDLLDSSKPFRGKYY